MPNRARRSETQIVVIMVLITIIAVRATAPIRLASPDCAPASISAKCRIVHR